MDRELAEQMVQPFVEMSSQYQVLRRSSAEHLLGEDAYNRLLADKIRNLGPTTDTIYVWNVVDLSHPSRSKSHEREVNDGHYHHC